MWVIYSSTGAIYTFKILFLPLFVNIYLFEIYCKKINSSNFPLIEALVQTNQKTKKQIFWWEHYKKYNDVYIFKFFVTKLFAGNSKPTSPPPAFKAQINFTWESIFIQ